ncbi:MAG: 4'-phosphopantetheinyl transferase superfamily protein [Acidimicrobiia bacterium]|nr:4'-phosphopantetheinyl transferase superfamily protein [Acidimicrobiia bacterium]
MPVLQPTWLAASLEDVAPDAEWVDEALAARLARMTYTKRYSEARLGRWAAKQAVAKTMRIESVRDVVIRNAPDGAPETLVRGRLIDAVIAMTDRSDWAVCMVLPGRTRIGCDLEIVEPRSRAFVSDYFTLPEQETVAAADDPAVMANLIWSAKESALKVLRTGLRQDTRTVEVTLLEHTDGEWRGLEVKEQTGRILPGWWLRHNEFVLTCAAEGPIAAPRSLVNPTPLAAAQPSHRWMEQPQRAAGSAVPDPR